MIIYFDCYNGLKETIDEKGKKIKTFIIVQPTENYYPLTAVCTYACWLGLCALVMFAH